MEFNFMKTMIHYLFKCRHTQSIQESPEILPFLSFLNKKEKDRSFSSLHITHMSNKPNNATIELALELYDHELQFEGLIRQLRSAINHKSYSFTYMCKDDNEYKATKRVLNKLLNGYLTTAQDKHDHSFYIRVSSSPKVIWFLNGGYMEIAIADITERTVAKIAKMNDVSYKVYRNAKIKEGDNEFDILFDIGMKRYAIEVKSGLSFHNYDKYEEILSKYDVSRKYFLFTQSYLTAEDLELIEDSHDLNVCSTQNYKVYLEDMIESTLGKHFVYRDELEMSY